MKKCPLCAEEIQNEALKCRYCNEMLPKAAGAPWYFSPGMMVFAFLCVGPFMLPLIWLHPTMARKDRIVWTSVISVISAVLTWATVQSVTRIWEYYKLLGSM